MTSTIKVNTITTASGSTLTVGGCGKTVALASGASQTGFGRTGTVDWQTTKKTTSFTAANGEGYFVDTAASGAVTMTLPSSPSAGNIVAVKDYNGNFNVANLTIGRGGSPINGANSADVVVTTAGASIVLVYVDATQGWVATQDDESTFAGKSFIAATGGSITTCGNDKIHTFTGPGTFAVSSAASCAANNLVSYLVVAGGGGGGHSYPTSNAGGGGGAGGYRELKSPGNSPYTASPLDGYPTPGNRITVTATSFPITVGGGGSGASTSATGTSGANSTFSTITSTGGGKGGHNGPGVPVSPAATGGSGGGGGGGTGAPGGHGCGAAGNTPSVTPSQGNNGGSNNKIATGNPPDNPGAGGGGATAVGQNGQASPCIGGAGGAGATTSINGTATARAGGGAGGGNPACGAGGSGGGGPSGTAGTCNTGGGGGATMNGAAGGNGGSGIVIIRYRFQ